MRIQELRELSFKLSYLPLVYPTFFLCVFLSHRSFSFRVLEKVGIRECKVLRKNLYEKKKIREIHFKISRFIVTFAYEEFFEGYAMRRRMMQ